ncbi:MAG: hypothetical protein QNL03_14880 [Gammaproteobacteria bacterium]|nr:hypothetical protein [Gammaproteobacteria bacterium]
MKILNYIEQHLNILIATLIMGSMILLISGCGEIDGGTVQNTVQLPMPEDSTLNFRCENEGIYLDTCVLDNPENPYASVAITEPKDEEPDEPCTELYDPTSKFTLSDDAPSMKAKYYVWATALAKGVGLQGENQYFTAFYLQAVYAESGSPTTRDQAVKAYRSLLDNYFLGVTFDKYEVVPAPECVEVKVAAALKDRVGENLYDPTDDLLISLYAIPDSALEDISEWGYVYDTTNKITSVFR